MKPDWDKLIGEFAESKTSLVADVDCTAAGKALCEKHGVQGYPTIKYGDPNDLQNYEGGRDYAELKKFAEENLGPSCGPENLDLCDEDTKKQIEDFQNMDSDALEKAIQEGEEKIQKIEAKHQKIVDKFEQEKAKVNEKISKEKKKHEDAVAKESKKIGLKIKKAVLRKKKKEEL